MSSSVTCRASLHTFQVNRKRVGDHVAHSEAQALTSGEGGEVSWPSSHLAELLPAQAMAFVSAAPAAEAVAHLVLEGVGGLT